jgi:hypothetical protein
MINIAGKINVVNGRVQDVSLPAIFKCDIPVMLRI